MQLLHILAVLVGIYFLVCLLTFFLQDRLVYFPDSQLIGDPGVSGLEFENVTLETADGVRLHAWFVPHPEARATVLFCHGNAGNISHRLDTVCQLNALGVNLLLFDYRGYGGSEGRPTERGTYSDAAAAWDHLVTMRGIAPDEIIIFGRSIGAAVAAELAVGREPAGLILESAFTSLPELGAIVYPLLPVRWLARIRYDTSSHVRVLSCPKLFLHSQDDEIVPFRMGRALHDTAAPPKQLVTLRGDHNSGFLLNEPDYSRALAEFVQSVARGRPPTSPATSSSCP